MLQGMELRCAIHPVLTSTFIKNKKGTGIKINKPRDMQIMCGGGGGSVSTEKVQEKEGKGNR